ncbi:MAG: ornithine cyclodeaminase family protein [Candidatus Tectomicrobia bacterium]|nr:ornithine cyclodeaminase family protein [Candidatus Tectomicrobia bacterium]
MPTLILTHENMQKVLGMEAAIEAMEGVFAAMARGEARMPPKVYIQLEEFSGDFRAMPSALGERAGVKWINAHPENPSRHRLPSVLGVYLLNDARTGYPLAVMDATRLTSYRTAAAAAVATRHLSRKDAKTLGIIGCGAQAAPHAEAVSRVRSFKEILLYDLDGGKAEALASSLKGLPARAARLEAACRADVLCTLTPSTRPIVRREWVAPGAHINAMGADGPGKQELDPAILESSRVFVDDPAQAIHGGEINVPISAGRFSAERIAGTLGEVLIGTKAGRTGQEITVFDSTGLALQDLALAKAAYEEARSRGIGLEIDLVPA